MAITRLTPILPKSKINASLLSGAVKLSARRVNKITLSEFKKTTRTWKTKPVFTETITSASGKTTARVQTDNRIYFYINFGTDYILVRFTPDFVTKTVPGWLGSRAGHPKAIYDGRRHPGIVPRKWDDLIVAKHGTRFGRILAEEIDNAVKSSGFAI